MKRLDTQIAREDVGGLVHVIREVFPLKLTSKVEKALTVEVDAGDQLGRGVDGVPERWRTADRDSATHRFARRLEERAGMESRAGELTDPGARVIHR
ncbi:hypothetical protein [Nocardioides immobilis]|uniref:hypothetical protein n=1 Tax=Nocardioides immobilis TaxID=2049295 RepID=UPI0015F9A957|nr:hypothetical protein [Nocardioides immobilis]